MIVKSKPSNTIVNDNKQLLNCIIIYYHNNIAIIYDISNLQKKYLQKKSGGAETRTPAGEVFRSDAWHLTVVPQDSHIRNTLYNNIYIGILLFIIAYYRDIVVYYRFPTIIFTIVFTIAIISRYWKV